MLPHKDGFEICRELRRSGVRTPIILLTARTHEAEKVMGLEAGADDYVTKPFSHRELRARIKAVLRRVVGKAQELFCFGDVEVDFTRGEVRRKKRPGKDHPAEFKLLTYFVRNRGRWLPQPDPRCSLGAGTYVTDRVVDNHVLSLRRKIEPDPQEPCYLISVRGVGYRFEGNIRRNHDRSGPSFLTLTLHSGDIGGTNMSLSKSRWWRLNSGWIVVVHSAGWGAERLTGWK